ncbi:MAG: LysM peptidoglycan-binding domain-containing protein [Chloroflexi bacterium]|nr:LysM peptidoglycan-binding domain-containing protein [Chloroflexota bacterium]MDL1882495.1 LysM peptidoglycan-binding domain-containing protein [Anaerolineae bacterium CFX8]
MQRDIGNEVVVAIVAIGALALIVMFAVILSLSGVETGDITTTRQAEVLTATTTPLPPTTLPTQTSTEAAARRPPSPTPALSVIPAATDTPAPTVTHTPTFTPSATWTLSDTPSPTYTSTPTATHTPRPTETSGIRPTPTGTLTAAPPIRDITAVCTLQPGWVAYTVRQNETLSTIARSVGSTPVSLQRANCLEDANQIYAGQVILVPRLPVAPPMAPVLTAAPGTQLAAEGCTAPSTQITNLTPGQRIGGVFTVRGTASADNFIYYKIEVRPDFAEVFNFFSRSETPVVDSDLATIDPAIFGAGLHWIKLTVISDTHQTPCVIPVIFQ